MSFEKYNGPLNRRNSLMSKEARFGYESYNNQKNKCNNPKNKWFKYYGGKGLKVHYSAREFIGWWLYNLKTFKGKTATVSRVDHNKGYLFENIKMECVSVNSRESFLRNKIPTLSVINTGIKISVHCRKTKNIIAIIPTIRETARLFNVSQRLIQKVIRGDILNTKKIPFEIREAQ